MAAFLTPRTGGRAALRGILAACLVLAAGCDFQPELRDGGHGVLTLSFDDAAGRAITSGRDLPADVLASFRYEVTFSGPEGETLNHSVSAGGSLSLTLALGDWRIDAAAYQGQILTGTGSLAFTLAAGENRVRVPMRLQGGYFEIGFSAMTGGAVASNFNAAFAGTPVTLIAAPAAGYRLLSMSAGGGVSLGGSGNSRTFTMPAADVTVSAEFEAAYAIHIAAMSGGTVTANPGAAFAGNTVTLTVTPDTGYGLKPNTLAVNGGAVPLTVSGTTTWTFTMPAGDVTVAAEFISGWRYVRETAQGTGDGSSWANASNDLQGMMDEAAAARAAGAPSALVRVAAGTYKPRYKPDATGASIIPPAGEERDVTFILRQGVEARGGYPATGGDDASRNPSPATNNTILSGDIGAANTTSDNVYHVVLGVNIDRRTILDGFTVSGGNADLGNDPFTIGGKSIQRINGGGIYLDSASPVLTNVTITGNSTTGIYGIYSCEGGGIYLRSASPVLTYVSITGNTVNGDFSRGGGIRIDYGSAPILAHVTIAGNESTQSDGGGMSFDNHSSPVLIDVEVKGNIAAYSGGGIFSDGSSSSILINVRITGNSSNNDGGGIWFGGSTPPYRSKLINVTIAGNFALNGGALHIYSDTLLDIRNSVIWGNTAWGSSGIELNGANPAITHSIVQDSSYPTALPAGNDGNMNIDPQFMQLVQASYYSPTTGGDYRLDDTDDTGSPAVNRANTAYYPDTWGKWAGLYNNGDIEHPITQDDYNAWVLPALQKDLGGNPRFNGIIDMGAYEKE
jgi:hypothetical protein